VHGHVHQTPVGYKYIGQLIREDKIRDGGEESAGSPFAATSRKRRHLACLLTRKMIAPGALPSVNKFAVVQKLGREFWPVREIFIFPTTKSKRRQARGV